MPAVRQMATRRRCLKGRFIATGRDYEKPCRGDSPCDGLDWSVYQNHYFQRLGPTLLRSHLRCLNRAPALCRSLQIVSKPTELSEQVHERYT
jgi:hypothetical protein